ncbi:MAG: hypothetical protein J7527_04155 [Chitinophagaceae bacterium]|nr:hypothetical protein [Chitinophagaceae bacterium]
MAQRYSYFFCIVFVSLFLICIAERPVAAGDLIFPGSELAAMKKDTVGKPFRPQDPFPVERQFRIVSEDKDHHLPGFKKGDMLRISTKNGLKHYRNKQLLNTYKIIPQPAVVTIQPQCRVAPCPPVDMQVLVYYMGQAQRYIDIRNNALLVSDSSYKDPDPSKNALRLKWISAYGLSSR